MADLLNSLALIFLPLSGYSFAATLLSRTAAGGPGGAPSPTLMDTAFIILLWTSGIVARLAGLVEGWWAVATWLIAATVISLAMGRARRQSPEGKWVAQ